MADKEGVSLDHIKAEFKAIRVARGDHQRATEVQENTLGFHYTPQMEQAAVVTAAQLETDEVLIDMLVRQGEKLEGALDRELRFPADATQIVREPGVRLGLEYGALTAVMIPHEQLDEKQIREIAAGEARPYGAALGPDYFGRVAAGELPVPTNKGYTVIAERVPQSGQTTRLSDAVGIENPEHMPIADMRAQVRARGNEALRGMGLDPKKVSIRPSSYREEALHRVANGVTLDTEVVTNTRVNRQPLHVVFTGGDPIKYHPESQNSIPGRLVVASRPLERDRYISSKK